MGVYYKELATAADYNSPESIASNWAGPFKVTSLPSAYSTMTLQKDNGIGFLYEEETHCNTSGGGYTIVYKRLTLDEITDGKYRYRK